MHNQLYSSPLDISLYVSIWNPGLYGCVHCKQHLQNIKITSSQIELVWVCIVYLFMSMYVHMYEYTNISTFIHEFQMSVIVSDTWSISKTDSCIAQKTENKSHMVQCFSIEREKDRRVNLLFLRKALIIQSEKKKKFETNLIINLCLKRRIWLLSLTAFFYCCSCIQGIFDVVIIQTGTTNVFN